MQIKVHFFAFFPNFRNFEVLKYCLILKDRAEDVGN